MAKTKSNPWLDFAPGGSQWPGTVWQPGDPNRVIAFNLPASTVPPMAPLPQLQAFQSVPPSVVGAPGEVPLPGGGWGAPPATPAPTAPAPAAPVPAPQPGDPAYGMPFPQGVQQGANVGSTSWPGLAQHWQYTLATPPASSGETARTGNELLSYLMQGHDWKNLSTRGMSGSGRAFKFGKVTYDPSKDTGRSWRPPKGSPKQVLHRGAAWNMFVYRMNQLMAQRDRGGNPDRGVRPDSTDEEIAALAAKFVNDTNMGSTGFTIG